MTDNPLYTVRVNGRDKGRVWRQAGGARWAWQRGTNKFAVERYPPDTLLDGVREHISRVYRVEVDKVTIEKSGEVL